MPSSKWLESLNTPDEQSKEKLRAGLTELASRADENAVWSVIACASNSWVANVNKLEDLQTQLNAYQEKEKSWQDGNFDSESSRIEGGGALGKRKADDISEPASNDIWSELENMMKASGGARVNII